MHRAAVRDLEQLRPLRRVERALEPDHPLDPVDLALARLAVGAVGGVDLVVLQLDLDALERQALQVGVEPHRHRGAAAERGEQQVVGRRPGVEAAGRDRLVGAQHVAAGRDELRELAFPRLAHDDLARDRVRRGGSGATEKALRPRGDHVAGIGCVLAAREQVVGGVERDEALRVPSAAWKMRVALSIVTVSSRGECMTRSALPRSRSVSSGRWPREIVEQLLGGSGTSVHRGRPRPRRSARSRRASG